MLSRSEFTGFHLYASQRHRHLWHEMNQAPLNLTPRRIPFLKRSTFPSLSPGFICLAGLVTCLFTQSATASPPGAYTNTALRRLWRPVADAPYLQEIGEKIVTDKPATSLAVYKDLVYVVVGGTLKVL